jgi:hypothetical protein
MTQTMKDNMFFVYGEAMLLLHDVVLELTCWSEGCPCHPIAESGQGRSHRSWKRLDARRRQELGGAACPMEGRRAPELAAGALRDMMSHLGSLKLGTLACARRRQLSDEQWREVVTDFEHGRAHMQTLLAIKLSAWDRLPWLLCGLAHHDEGVARSCAARAALLFDSTPAAVSHMHHAITSAFLSREAPGGRAPAASLRDDLDKFVGGEALVNLSPRLLSAVAKLKFIPVVERDMEAKHKDVKHVLASLTRHSAARVSLAIRGNQLWTALSLPDADVAAVEYLGLLDVARQPRQAAAELGLLSHPMLHEMQADAAQNGRPASQTQWLKT